VNEVKNGRNQPSTSTKRQRLGANPIASAISPRARVVFRRFAKLYPNATDIVLALLKRAAEHDVRCDAFALGAEQVGITTPDGRELSRLAGVESAREERLIVTVNDLHGAAGDNTAKPWAITPFITRRPIVEDNEADDVERADIPTPSFNAPPSLPPARSPIVQAPANTGGGIAIPLGRAAPGEIPWVPSYPAPKMPMKQLSEIERREIERQGNAARREFARLQEGKDK
jgi:hypothetical protein